MRAKLVLYLVLALASTGAAQAEELPLGKNELLALVRKANAHCARRQKPDHHVVDVGVRPFRQCRQVPLVVFCINPCLLRVELRPVHPL